MPTWNELFLKEENIKQFPQTEIYWFVKKLEGAFTDTSLRIWDHCCGGGLNIEIEPGWEDDFEWRRGCRSRGFYESLRIT